MTVFLPSPEVLESPRGRDLTPGTRALPRTDALPARAEVVLVGGGLAALSMAGTLWHAGVGDTLHHLWRERRGAGAGEGAAATAGILPPGPESAPPEPETALAERACT